MNVDVMIRKYWDELSEFEKRRIAENFTKLFPLGSAYNNFYYSISIYNIINDSMFRRYLEEHFKIRLIIDSEREENERYIRTGHENTATDTHGERQEKTGRARVRFKNPLSGRVQIPVAIKRKKARIKKNRSASDGL